MNDLLMLFVFSLYIACNLMVLVGWFIIQLSQDNESMQIYSFILKLDAFLTVLMIGIVLKVIS